MKKKILIKKSKKMADSTKMDNQYVQQGEVCVLASYALIINYFSEGELSVEEILNRYAGHGKIDISVSQINKENKIKEHYYIEAGSERGFNYIACNLHNGNVIDTRKYCQVIAHNAELEAISDKEKEELKDKLKENDRIVMCLFPSSHGYYHACVFGWDNDEREYFTRDPQNGKIDKIDYSRDILKEKIITEYILFEKGNKDSVE